MANLDFQSVLVPTDFSDQAHDAVDVGLEVAQDPTKLTVLHVAPALSNVMISDPAVAWHEVSNEDRSEQMSRKFRERFGNTKYGEVRFEVVFGAPAEEITRFAEREEIDVIVLPSHGRTGLARLMIGSVAERVVRLAHCPVLVLRD